MAWMGLRARLPNLVGRKGAILLTDVLLAGAAQIALVAILLRFDHPADWFEIAALSMLVAMPVLWLVQAHSQVWHRVSLPDLVAMVRGAILIGPVIGLYGALRFTPATGMRLTIGSIVMLTCAWSAPRVLYRLRREWSEARAGRNVQESEAVVLYGSGPRADQFLRINERTRRYHVLGIFHDNPALRGRRLRRIASHGTLASLPDFLLTIRARGYAPKRLIVTEDRERDDELAAALDAAAVNGLRLARLPSMNALVEGGGGAVTPVSIEDILHRDPVSLPHGQTRAALAGAVVLVTGAGGSIGSELVRQVAAFGPARLVLVEFGEFNLYQIDAALQRDFPHVPRATALCDVRDLASLDRVFAAHRPDVVLHAAALKHVPLLEDHPEQAVVTNVLGTHNVATCASTHGAAVMTLVSTDKAVNPTNVMGATKRWAEMICQAFDAEAPALGHRTRFACVRFGNVLDSAGSVVPLFRRQIADGGPVTVTHADMTRYFMTIPEACELILVAAGATLAGERRRSLVYVLDMGEPVRILSLAERMIQLHGLRPHEDVRIEFVGLRRGEKLYEELAHGDEALTPAPFPKASLARSRAPSMADLTGPFEMLVADARADRRDALLDGLKRLVPEYDDAGSRAVPTPPVVQAAE